MTSRELMLGPEGALQPVEVNVGAQQPVPWDGTSELQQVGTPVPRADGALKVTGAARYTTDIRLEGMLYCDVLRSPHPSAIIRQVNVSAAKKMPGVKAVYVIAEPDAYVRYEGQEIVAVAAETLQQARDAVSAIDVDLEVLPHAADLEDALRFDAPLVYPSASKAPGKGKLPITGNVRGPARGGRRFSAAGDVDKGFTASAAVVEQIYRTSVQTHSCMEPHGCVARVASD